MEISVLKDTHPEETRVALIPSNVKKLVGLGANIAIEQGIRFAIREGGRTVGAGVVSKIID